MKIRRKSQQRTKIAVAAKRLAEHKDAIVWGRIPGERGENEAVCLLFQKIEWSEAMRPANGLNRYQIVKVEEAFNAYNISINIPRKVVEQKWDNQFHLGKYEELCDDKDLELEKFRAYDEEKRRNDEGQKKRSDKSND